MCGYDECLDCGGTDGMHFSDCVFDGEEHLDELFGGYEDDEDDEDSLSW